MRCAPPGCLDGSAVDSGVIVIDAAPRESREFFPSITIVRSRFCDLNRVAHRMMHTIYIDGTRAELAGASRQPPASRSSGDFDCIAPLRAMSAGTHTRVLTTFIVDGQLIESPHSAPL